MKEQVTLESKEVRAIIARFLQIPEDQVITKENIAEI